MSMVAAAVTVEKVDRPGQAQRWVLALPGP